MTNVFALLILFSAICFTAQSKSVNYDFADSVQASNADTVHAKAVEVVDSHYDTPMILRLSDFQSGAIYSAKKTELIRIRDLTLNTATNNARQAFSTVAGLNIWESDGAGVQLGIGGRGLSPDRTSNFTVRQNGYDISADPLGYPESYYTPPIDALDKIEIVRGAGSLRYGTQFGGMLNFVMKEGARGTPLAVRTRIGAGSFGFAHGFVEAGGTESGVNYHALYQYKRSDGWRPNSEFDMHTANASVSFFAMDVIRIKAEYTFMSYLAHQPGGLTDVQFNTDPTISVRERNWFTVNWNLASISADIILDDRTSFKTMFFGNISSRDAVGNLSRINMADLGGPRTLISGQFENIGNETTVTTFFDAFADTVYLVAGMRLYHGTTTQQQGDGSSGSDANFTFTNPDDLEGSDYIYPNDNVAVFAESIIPIVEGLNLVPGLRFEHITTRADGWYRNRIRDLAGNIVVDTTYNEHRVRSRNLLLGGIGLSWNATSDLELYANASQNYRSITFADLRVSNPNLVVDPNINDESGYTLDLGFRGNALNCIAFDASAFYLRYNNRIGEVLRSDEPPFYLPYTYRTNIADAYTAGVEAVADLDVSAVLGLSADSPTLHWIINGSVLTGKYLASQERSIEGNTVEFVAPYILRTSLRVGWKGFSCSYTSGWVGKHYTDASNAEYTASAVSGAVPAYHVGDVTASYKLDWFSIDASCTNVFGASYFTRRASAYPGPGIIPAEPLSFFVTAQLKL